MPWVIPDKVNGPRPKGGKANNSPSDVRNVTTIAANKTSRGGYNYTAGTSAHHTAAYSNGSRNGSSGSSGNGGDEYELAKYGYGKNYIKLLHVQRDGPLHSVREYEVDTHLRLNSQRDYLQGDNKDIIATDTQKNIVYVLAKRKGVESPEAFALLVCSHFLYTYHHVEEVSVHVEEYPWERLQSEDQPHNHAFVFSPSTYRFCTVNQKRNERPRITGGLRGLRVLKTTQSAFTDFIQDEYRTLPDVNDRVFSTIVTANWEYSTANGVNFDNVWDTVKECILDKFAGPPDEGIFSPSVQNTLYLAEKTILDKVQQIQRIEMEMPNKHYFTLDVSKFPPGLVQGADNEEVYTPVDKPSGIIYAMLERKSKTTKPLVAKL